jgi:TM2 domain-containing membrane protein YozV
MDTDPFLGQNAAPDSNRLMIRNPNSKKGGPISVSTPATKYCVECGESMGSLAKVCPKCGVRQPLAGADSDPEEVAEVRDISGKKIAAGVCAILLGSLGVHKFILGLTTPGIIMLLVTLTCVGSFPMHIIGIVEGIIYLTKSDKDFYQTYIVEKKGWF